MTRDNYTVHVTYPDVTPGQFAGALYGIDMYSDATYHLANFNCTTFVIRVMEAAQLSIPKTIAQIGLGSGYSPGQLGWDLRNWQSNPNVNRATHQPGISHKACQ